MGESAVELGTLERADPSSLWNHEARDFTPWLLENADGLASQPAFSRHIRFI